MWHDWHFAPWIIIEADQCSVYSSLYLQRSSIMHIRCINQKMSPDITKTPPGQYYSQLRTIVLSATTSTLNAPCLIWSWKLNRGRPDLVIEWENHCPGGKECQSGKTCSKLSWEQNQFRASKTQMEAGIEMLLTTGSFRYIFCPKKHPRTPWPSL